MPNLSIKTKRTPPRVRGYLRRFFLEVDRNLFVGNATQRVVDLIWERLTSGDYADSEKFEDFSATLIIFSRINEQGFTVREYNQDRKFRSTENSGIVLSEKIQSQKSR